MSYARDVAKDVAAIPAHKGRARPTASGTRLVDDYALKDRSTSLTGRSSSG